MASKSPPPPGLTRGPPPGVKAPDSSHNGGGASASSDSSDQQPSEKVLSLKSVKWQEILAKRYAPFKLDSVKEKNGAAKPAAVARSEMPVEHVRKIVKDHGVRSFFVILSSMQIFPW